MDMSGVRQQLQAEAMRRSSGQPASNVGTQPNPSASQPTTNPMASRQSMGNPAMPSGDNPMAGAMGAMNGASTKVGGSELITKALIKRLNMYDPAAF